MIPELTLDIESIEKNWKNKEDQEEVKKHCEAVGLCFDNDKSDLIPIYLCDNNWVGLGVFKEYKQISEILVEHGYCDREEDLELYLQSYLKDPDNNYFVSIGFMDMDYEKYYKHGSYINKDGEDTGDDYWPYIDQHKDEEGRQQFPSKWITFGIHKLA